MELRRFNRLEWYHTICRNGFYATTQVTRCPVPDNLVGWPTSKVPAKEKGGPCDWPEYAPVEYTSPTIHDKPWADPDISDSSFNPKWNSVDGPVDRQSYGRGQGVLPYVIGDDGRPQNPLGRTGITGRGLLGRWGPNHAADPIITRWKTPSTVSEKDEGKGDKDKEIEEDEKDTSPKKDILQFVAIQRRDTKQWAIPGGMVDPEESVYSTLKREFMEEALNSGSAEVKLRLMTKKIDELFKRGDYVYKGYMDDPRNTDNAWMETTAVNFHDNDGTVFNSISLSAGDDACKVKWVDIDEKLDLYAEHSMLLRYVAILRNAHWQGSSGN